MNTDYWQKQGTEALFPELEWNKPERRDQAGRVLIVGGDLHNLTAPALSYQHVKTQGIGDVKVALPDKTKKLVGATLPDAVFLPSTTTGEFSYDGVNELLGFAQWADCLLLPGDNGRNSQTTRLLEELVQSTTNQLIISRDAVDNLSHNAKLLLDREKTTLVVSFAELQKLAKNSGATTALTYSMNLQQLVEFLHIFSQDHVAAIVTLHQNQLIVASHGNICTTKLKEGDEPPPPAGGWRIEIAALAACYQTWNPFKPFEALSFISYLLAKTLN